MSKLANQVDASVCCTLNQEHSSSCSNSFLNKPTAEQFKSNSYESGSNWRHKLNLPAAPLIHSKFDLFANINSILQSGIQTNKSENTNGTNSHTIHGGASTNLNANSINCKVSDRQRLEQSIVRLFATGRLEPGELTDLHTLVRNILNSKAGLFLYDNYSTQILPKGLQQLCYHLVRFESDGLLPVGEPFLIRLGLVWHMFFTNILPTIECILYRLQSKCNLTLRQTSLRAFRDDLLLKLNLEESLLNQKKCKKVIPEQIKHMLLVLNALMDTFPPQKNKLKIEQMTNWVINPFHGYKGLFLDHEDKPSYPSSEPILYANRKSVDINYRRISRPLTVQPKQIETLNELFLSVIKRQGHKHHL